MTLKHSAQGDRTLETHLGRVFVHTAQHRGSHSVGSQDPHAGGTRRPGVALQARGALGEAPPQPHTPLSSSASLWACSPWASWISSWEGSQAPPGKSHRSLQGHHLLLLEESEGEGVTPPCPPGEIPSQRRRARDGAADTASSSAIQPCQVSHPASPPPPSPFLPPLLIPSPPTISFHSGWFPCPAS